MFGIKAGVLNIFKCVNNSIDIRVSNTFVKNIPNVKYITAEELLKYDQAELIEFISNNTLVICISNIKFITFLQDLYDIQVFNVKILEPTFIDENGINNLKTLEDIIVSITNKAEPGENYEEFILTTNNIIKYLTRDNNLKKLLK